MPLRRELYPADWPAISLRIRNRDRWRCKMCDAPNGLPHPDTGSIVVLTVAHLDHDTTNNTDANLAALCQRCHLNLDRPHHLINAAITRRLRRIAHGQIPMEGLC